MNILFPSGTNYPGLFGTTHFICLGVFVVLLVFEILLFKKILKNDKAKNLAVKIIASIHLLFILLNRLFIAIKGVYYDGASWIKLVPDSFCGFCSLALSLTVILSKKESLLMHFLVYMGFFGGVATMFYPDFLESQLFLDSRTYTGLLHHAFMVYNVLALFLSNTFKISFKKSWVFPVGFSVMMLIGVFEKYVLGFNHAMNIGSPLIGDLPILTSWYMIGIVSSIFILLLSYTIEKINSKKHE